MGKINEIVADGVTVKILEERAAAFVDREKQTFSRYAELFPNYEWTDSATAIDFMAAEIKCLRSELLDACRLATSMREFARPEYATTRTAEWGNWKKLCARLTALRMEIRARWCAGTFSDTAAPEDGRSDVGDSCVMGTGPGDCMNFGTPEQLAEFPNPQPLSKIASARRKVDLDARNRERKA